MNPIYFIDINATSCTVEVSINGFPAIKMNAEYSSNYAQSINQYLIGKNNVITIQAIPTEINTANPTAMLEAINRIQLSGAIKLYKPNEVSCPEGGLSIRKFSFDKQTNGQFHFDNHIYDFSDLFQKTGKVRDSKLVKAYALKLLQLSNGNLRELATEFEPKMNDYAIAFSENPSKIINGFRSFLDEQFFALPTETIEVPPEELYVKSYCDDRIFEVGLLPDRPLLSRDAGEGEEYNIAVYIGLVENSLKVVR